MRATMVFTGRFRPESFAEFIGHRARRLDLAADVEELGEERIAVAVAGQADLVDAFEVACSLGPLDCLVLDVERRDG